MSLGQFCQQRLDVERQRRHLDLAVAPRPLGRIAVSVDLDSVAIWVGQVERLAHEVIGGARQANPGITQAYEDLRQVAARWHPDRDMEEAGGTGRRRRTALALP